MSLLHGEVTEKVIGAFHAVYNTLGSGFAERVYHNALVIELTRRGLTVESEKPIRVHYRGECVGDFFADIVVNDSVIVEIKAVSELTPEHRAQLLNYLKATQFEVGLLLNFGKSPESERRVYKNSLKGSMNWLASR